VELENLKMIRVIAESLMTCQEKILSAFKLISELNNQNQELKSRIDQLESANALIMSKINLLGGDKINCENCRFEYNVNICKDCKFFAEFIKK
jgi:hypothetical protein